MTANYIKKILEANVYDVAIESPLDLATNLSDRFSNKVFLKREDLQSVFSFKLRGAYNKINSMSDVQRKQGVVTASAGNHAQGVALAASKLKIPATIVMGTNTPEIKVNAVRKLGAKVVLQGNSYDEASEHARNLEQEFGLTYIHPFDDPEVIAGQGTIAMEMLRQHTEQLDAVFIPVGGGGLISGMGTYIKYLRPEVKVIGVEAEGSACLYAALEANKRVRLNPKDLDQFADGTSVSQVGKETFRLAKLCVDEVIKVSVDEICAGIKDIFEDTRSISEPSGALSVAGMKKYIERNGAVGESYVAVVSGANMNFDRLRHVSERTDIGERREALIGVTIPEKPGSFRRFCNLIGKRNVTEFNYRFADQSGAKVLVGIQTRMNSEDKQQILKKLQNEYHVVDLSENEVAVLHVRHMVGGSKASLPDEKLFRFEFPERPGALLDFLNLMGDGFNITMFHYRNHGAAYGRVLAGIQVPMNAGSQSKGQLIAQFKKDLQQNGYRFWEETDNDAYSMFLKNLD